MLFVENVTTSINSGYRSAAVNRAIGGVTSSQHSKGEAADIDATDNAPYFSLFASFCPSTN